MAVKLVFLVFSMFVFVFASAYSPAELENLSTIIHLTQHEKASHHTHDTHHHEHNSKKVNFHANQPHGNLITISHRHSSQNPDENNNEPHEHHLDLFSGFTAMLIDTSPLEAASFNIPKPLLLEPSQLISDPHKSRLFRPPIS